MDDREVRGYSIIASGVKPKCIDEETFVIPSQSGDGKYKVTHKQEWICECPDFKHRHLPCKHIRAVQFWIKLRGNIHNEDVKDFEEKVLNDLKDDYSKSRCIFCNSENIIKNGQRKTKYGIRQRYRCKNCKKKFVLDPIRKHKVNGKMITLTMDLYFKGLSLRDIQNTLYQFFGLIIHHETIRRWIMKFTKSMNDYVENNIKLEPSNVWHCDEQMVKSKGKWLWVWNLMDRETRFLLASTVTEERGIDDARKVFHKGKEMSKFIPEYIITDGLNSYERAIKKEFRFGTHHKVNYTKHIKNVGINDKPNNNVIERFHGSFREFDKIRRGFKGKEIDVVDAFRIYYNYIRPHKSLDGLTPAEFSGLKLDLGRNKWLGLIEKSY
jgi:transposase-like protein